MFIVTNYSMKQHIPMKYRTNKLNDIKDLIDMIIGITGDEQKGIEAGVIASNMKFGDIHSARSYRIECVRE